MDAAEGLSTGIQQAERDAECKLPDDGSYSLKRPKYLQNPEGSTYCRIARRLCEEAAKLEPKRCQMVTKHKVASPAN